MFIIKSLSISHGTYVGVFVCRVHETKQNGGPCEKMSTFDVTNPSYEYSYLFGKITIFGGASQLAGAVGGAKVHHHDHSPKTQFSKPKIYSSIFVAQTNKSFCEHVLHCPLQLFEILKKRCLLLKITGYLPNLFLNSREWFFL